MATNKKLSEAKKMSLINKAERVMGHLIDLMGRMAEAGISTSIYSQSATRPLREIINLIERS